MAASILFFVFAIVAISAALGMVVSKNPVNSALWLILNLFSIAGLYLTLNAGFIAVIQILVYAGAIMVLFLFVIMLLNLAALPDLKRVEWRKILAYCLGMGLLAEITYVVAGSLDILPEPVTMAVAADNASAGTLGRHLFTTYAMPVEIIGVLLLAATIGAVMLAKRTPV